METQGTRRSDRVTLELPIEVSGTDTKGSAHLESTHTVLISLHGAKIVLSRAIVPHQELTIRCQSTGREAEARVVEHVGGGGFVIASLMFLVGFLVGISGFIESCVCRAAPNVELSLAHLPEVRI